MPGPRPDQKSTPAAAADPDTADNSPAAPPAVLNDQPVVLEPMLSARAVAEFLAVDERTLRRWAKSGLLVPRRLGRSTGATLRYHPADIDAFLSGEASEK